MIEVLKSKRVWAFRRYPDLPAEPAEDRQVRYFCTCDCGCTECAAETREGRILVFLALPEVKVELTTPGRASQYRICQTEEEAQEVWEKGLKEQARRRGNKKINNLRRLEAERNKKLMALKALRREVTEAENEILSVDLKMAVLSAEVRSSSAAFQCPRCGETACICPDPTKPCPHPARGGQHEEYLTGEGKRIVCRACGAEGDVEEFYYEGKEPQR